MLCTIFIHSLSCIRNSLVRARVFHGVISIYPNSTILKSTFQYKVTIKNARKYYWNVIYISLTEINLDARFNI